MLATTLTDEQLDEALAGVEHLERVEIAIVPGGFSYRLFGDGREVVAGLAEREQLAAMLQVTEVLLNPELGLRHERLCLAGCN
jgi:phosphoribosylformylglycinamidine (FGAM) synthase-like amidotransferase family enzyme